MYVCNIYYVCSYTSYVFNINIACLPLNVAILALLKSIACFYPLLSYIYLSISIYIYVVGTTCIKSRGL